MTSLLAALATASLLCSLTRPSLVCPVPVTLGSQSGRHAAEDRFAADVSSDRLRQHVRDLVALGPRMGGTPSGDRAADHLEKLFRGFGLATRIERDPPLLAHWEEDWAVEIAPAGGRLESAWPYGFSPSVESATGELVAVQDLGAPDPSWAGRVLYTPGSVGRTYDAVAQSPHRPLAILTSAPNDPKKYIDWSRIGALPARDTNPIPVFALSYLDGRTVEAAAGHAAVRVHLRAATRLASPATVVAELGGRDPAKYYLVTAHGDSDAGGPGADDNASGVATVVEIARGLGSLARSGAFQPAYSVRFVVWGTEHHSAKAYIEREGAQLAGCLGVINFDETGTGAEREALYVESNEVPWNADLIGALKAVGGDYLNRAGFWPEFYTNASQGGTDSYAFLPKEYKGAGHTTLKIPATTVYTAAWDALGRAGDVTIDYSAYYHSSGDTPENTTEREPQNMVRAVKAVGIALLRLLR